MKPASLHLYVSGYVQGVFFRLWTKNTAKTLGLNGWVKNLKDGRVEVAVEGEKNILVEFLSLIKVGPKLARVSKIEEIWEDAVQRYVDFEIL